jgi:phosphatidylglycerol:prolipoprotein diacylglycerol transferase
MHPVLFELPWGASANAYGTMILLGSLLCMVLTYKDMRARRLGKDGALSLWVDYWLALVVGSFVGGRALHIVTSPEVYRDDWGLVLAFDGTGFVYFGSVAASTLGIALVARRHAAPLGAVIDVSATWLGLEHAFGRLGCWLAGCCWGAPAHRGAVFPPESMAWRHGEVPRDESGTVPLFPTQLVEVGGLLVILGAMAVLRLRRGIETPWRQASRYAVAYGLLRLFTEATRGDPSRGMIFEIPIPALSRLLGLSSTQPVLLSGGQLVAIALVVVGAIGLRRTRAAAARDRRGPAGV